MTESAELPEQAELDVIAERIDRLVRDPDAIRRPFTSLSAPVMRAFKWQPEVETEELQALVARSAMTELEADLLGAPSLAQQLLRARRELESNLTAVERARVVYGSIPFAYAGWLHRVHGILAQLTSANEERSWNERRIAHAAKVDLKPPLLARGKDEVVHVGAIDPLIRAAEAEKSNLGRRRRLLEAARELLLDAGAALQLDDAALAARREHIARSLNRLSRYQAAGLEPDVGLVHQLRKAAERRDGQRLHAALSALDDFAVASGDKELAGLSTRALDGAWSGRSRFTPEARAESLARSGAESFDARIHRAIEASRTAGADQIAVLKKRVDAGELKHHEVEQAEAYLAVDGVPLALSAALAVDGCFDVGGVLSPVRVVEHERRRRLVQYPSSHLVLAPARGPEDIPHAVIEDPRSVLLSLAAGRLLARRFAVDEVRKRERTVLRGEIRVYVLDGSTSMLGHRARMRDAILVAELCTLIARKNDARRSIEPVLYYRYFTRALGEVTRVGSEGEALAQIERVLGRVHVGGTDIEQALLSSFELISGAAARDRDLASGQIVLITDGEAPVDADKILAARKRSGGLPIGVSIIALGQENPALRALAARQRTSGERVFYQYISDRELSAYVRGIGSGPPIHAPATFDVGAATAELVDEIEAYERREEAEGLEQARDQRLALEELELSLTRDFGEGERAHFEARARDGRALARRFERWFGRGPAPGAARRDPALFEPPSDDRQDLELLETLLGSVADVVELIGGGPLGRTADAIEIFERLLLDAGMPPRRYSELCRRYADRVEPALARVRTLAKPEL